MTPPYSISPHTAKNVFPEDFLLLRVLFLHIGVMWLINHNDLASRPGTETLRCLSCWNNWLLTNLIQLHNIFLHKYFPYVLIFRIAILRRGCGILTPSYDKVSGMFWSTALKSYSSNNLIVHIFTASTTNARAGLLMATQISKFQQNPFSKLRNLTDLNVPGWFWVTPKWIFRGNICESCTWCTILFTYKAEGVESVGIGIKLGVCHCLEMWCPDPISCWNMRAVWKCEWWYHFSGQCNCTDCQKLLSLRCAELERFTVCQWA